MAAAPANPTIYLVPSRPWLFELGASGLSAVSDEALDFVCRDTDILWLQGAWELGPAGVEHDLSDDKRVKYFEETLEGDFTLEDCIGSPYAITSYTLNPTLGTDADLASFRERLRSRGVKLMLDFVPNHTARDSPWIHEPDMYVPGKDGAPAFGRDCCTSEWGDWTDVAQLNYWSSTCRARMIDTLMSVADKCDGCRIDVAMLCCNAIFEETWGDRLRSHGFQPPENEFWPQAFARVRERYPNFIAMAECYEYPEITPGGTGKLMLEQGFDVVYDKVTYDMLYEDNMDSLREQIFSNPLTSAGKLVHFTENHDEPRSASYFGVRSLAATAVSLTLPGPRLVMWGQERGRKNRLAVQLRRSQEELVDEPVASAFRRLLAALPSCRGTWAPLAGVGSPAKHLLAWGWKGGNGSVALLVANYSDTQLSTRVATAEICKELPASEKGTVELKEVLSGEQHHCLASDLLGEKGLEVVLDAFGARLYVSSP